jgi:hypothetical protein
MAAMTGPQPRFTPGGEYRPYPPQRHFAGRHHHAPTAPLRVVPDDVPPLPVRPVFDLDLGDAPHWEPPLEHDELRRVRDVLTRGAAPTYDRLRVEWDTGPEPLAAPVTAEPEVRAGDAVIPGVPGAPAEPLAPAFPVTPDDGGRMRDLIAAALRSHAGTLDAIVLVCGQCRDAGKPCARHAARVGDAGQAWSLAEEISRSLTSRDALLLLLVQAEEGVAGD